MIDKKSVEEFIAGKLEGTDYFPVEVKVSGDNEIKIDIDSMGSVDIDFCVELSRAFEEAFPREEEDYELEVGSAGITSPFKVRRQYEKNVGNDVEVVTADGRKLRGVLAAVDDGASLSARSRKSAPKVPNAPWSSRSTPASPSRR